MLTLRQLAPEEIDWALLDRLPDRLIFQTREWLSFIARTQQAEPVVAEVLDAGSTVGYFSGVVFRRYGVRILGSPFPGWTTPYIGFNLDDGVSRRDAAEALIPFAFDSLGCFHLELRDRYLASALDDLGFKSEPAAALEVDLRPEESEIWARFTGACRRCIRKAEKSGVAIEEAADQGFADDYYAQLTAVFARQSLRPTYSIERVRELIRAVHPTGRLLLLRARDPEGTCIATGIFPAMNTTMYFWGGASWREHQILRPNEALFWYAIRHWKSRGVIAFDLGGGGDYKQKYGPVELTVPFWIKSRVRALSGMRHLAKRAAARRLRA